MIERKPVVCKVCQRVPAVIDNIESVTVICPNHCVTICEDTKEEAVELWNKINENTERENT